MVELFSTRGIITMRSETVSHSIKRRSMRKNNNVSSWSSVCRTKPLSKLEMVEVVKNDVNFIFDNCINLMKQCRKNHCKCVGKTKFKSALVTKTGGGKQILTMSEAYDYLKFLVNDLLPYYLFASERLAELESHLDSSLSRITDESLAMVESIAQADVKFKKVLPFACS